MGANWSSDDFFTCSPAPTSRTSFPYEPSCISSSTPSLRISSAPSVRASMRSRLEKSATPPPVQERSPPTQDHLDNRSLPQDPSQPDLHAKTPKPTRVESTKSFPTEMAFSCPAMVAVATPVAYSASIPSARPTSGLAKARPVDRSVLDLVPGPVHGLICGTIHESNSNRSSALGSTHSPASGSIHDCAYTSNHDPTLGPTCGSTSGPAYSPTHNSSGLTVSSTHGSSSGPALGYTHGPAPLPSSALPLDPTPVNGSPCAAGPPSSTPHTQPPTPPPPLPPHPLGPLEGNASCPCGREVELLRNETRLLRAELTKTRQTIMQMKEREKMLRHRLSEQARRQIERGSTKFEDISLGENRPSQLIRRYGNLYSDGRLEAMDALDELKEVAEFTDLKEKLLLSVIVLAFRNARKNLEDMKSKVRQLLHISESSPPLPPRSSAPSSSSAHDPAVTLRSRPLPPSHPAVVELEEIISVYLRKTLDHQNLTKNYQEVRERVWATLFDFPKLRFCRGLQQYIEECVRLAWALSLQNPPFVVDYKAKTFSPDTHARFHTSDPDSIKVRWVLWPALREGGDTGPCVYKGVVVT